MDDSNDIERIVDAYVDELSDEELLERIPPDVRKRLQSMPFKERKAGSSRFLRSSFVLSGIAVAACLLVFLWPRSVDMGLVVDVAGDKDALFHRDVDRVAINAEFWFGIECAVPCWIHLVERVESGTLVLMQPNPSSDEYSMEVRDRAILGPFATLESVAPNGPSPVSHVIVIASLDVVPSDQLAATVSEELTAGPVDLWATRIKEELVAVFGDVGWQVRVEAIDPER